MRFVFRLAAAMALPLALTPVAAQAAKSPCLSPAEFSSLAGYALPSVIKGTSKRCAPTLGATAFLRSDGDRLATRYSANKGNTWPGAKAAFLKLSGSGNRDAGDILRKMPDEALQGMLDSVFEGLVAQEIPVERCSTIDSFIRLLSPLPPENTAELIALTVGLASHADKTARVGQLELCPAAK